MLFHCAVSLESKIYNEVHRVGDKLCQPWRCIVYVQMFMIMFFRSTASRTIEKNRFRSCFVSYQKTLKYYSVSTSKYKVNIFSTQQVQFKRARQLFSQRYLYRFGIQQFTIKTFILNGTLICAYFWLLTLVDNYSY